MSSTDPPTLRPRVRGRPWKPGTRRPHGAVDDFGTGWSSLSQLRSTTVEVLTIDRSFVSTTDQDPSWATIVRAIIAMAHALGQAVVAEGVERRGQAVMLEGMGCDLAQGWWLGYPVTAHRITESLGLDGAAGAA